jgi:hypothetical protein
MNCNEVWICHQSFAKLAEHNEVQPVYVPVHTRIEGNKIADMLARMGCELLLVAPEPACVTSVEAGKKPSGTEGTKSIISARSP